MSSGQVVVLLVVALFCGAIARRIGKRKGRERQGLLLGLFLSVIGIVIIACLSPTDEARAADAQKQYEMHAEVASRAGYPFPSHGVQRLKARWQSQDWNGRTHDIAVVLAILFVLFALVAMIVNAFHLQLPDWLNWLNWLNSVDCRKHPDECHSGW